MNAALRVVFDCNVYFQAMISKAGPANACVQRVVQRQVALYSSRYTVAEFENVCSRPDLRRRFSITDVGVAAMVSLMTDFATVVDDVSEQYQVRSDPKDSHYVNLALSVQAHLIVSRDTDLIRLRDVSHADGAEFVRRYPHLEIMEPPQLLELLGKRTER